MIGVLDELSYDLSQIRETIRQALKVPVDLSLRFANDKAKLRAQWSDRRGRIYFEMRTQLDGLSDKIQSRRTAMLNLRETELTRRTEAPEHDKAIEKFDELLRQVELTERLNETLLEEELAQ